MILRGGFWMNLPNKLTLLRVLMIPVCVALEALGMYPWALGVFLCASATDFLDGYLARKNGQITVFGKFADPVADKLLVLCAMIQLAADGALWPWAVCVVAARELAVDGLRLVAAGKKRVVAAKMPGKIKTVLQMVCVSCAMLGRFAPLPGWLVPCLTAAMAAATVYSGAKYFTDLKDVFAEPETGSGKE